MSDSLTDDEAERSIYKNEGVLLQAVPIMTDTPENAAQQI